jgi:hypothetical protein
VHRYLIFLVLLLPACWLSCAPAGGEVSNASQQKHEIQMAAGTAVLDIPDWEMKNLTLPIGDSKAYGRQIISQALLRTQIKEVLKENGIEAVPDVRFRLERPPYLLVVSPRGRIEYFDRILLSPDLSLREIEEIENKVESLGYSALVAGIGGIGVAYPAIVSPEMDTKYIINAAVEEWAHQYLALRPLGFLYLLDSLGFRQRDDAIVMNETLAGMIADEIGSQVYLRYYPGAAQPVEKPAAGKYNFAAEMRQTRSNVDLLLKAGELDAAGQYMEKRRLEFEANGYHIRKLNQAYFAFHGIYGDDPGTVSPVYQDMLRLRRGYTSLAGFINDASAMTCYAQLQELRDSLGK